MNYSLLDLIQRQNRRTFLPPMCVVLHFRIVKEAFDTCDVSNTGKLEIDVRKLTFLSHRIYFIRFC